MSTTTTPAPQAPALRDLAAREAISADTARTLFVAAGAGSGKTTALVRRILTLILVDGFAIEQIAAVTFTERAAADLRDRVRLDLEAVVREGGDARRLDRARAALDALDLAAIGTLHSFAQRILTRHAIEAGIPPAVRVLDALGASVAGQQQWSLLWSRLVADEQVSEALDLALDLGITSRHLREIAARLDAHPDLVAEHIREVPDAPLPVAEVSTFLRRAHELTGDLPECLDGTDRYALHLEALATWVADAPTGEDAQAIRPVLAWLSAAPKVARNAGAKARWPRGFDLAGTRERAVELHEDAVAARLDVLDAVLRRLTAWLGRAMLEAAAARRAAGELTFSDLLVLARNLLRDRPEVRAELQARYPRILLDEFQDTDPLQIEIAARIAGGAAAGQERWQDVEIPPGSLFVVGDPKQSIYRFRRADISLYLEAQRVLGGHTSLTTNFRSLTPVIDWVNAVFGSLIEAEDHVQPPYEDLSPHRDQRVVGPEVAVLGEEAHEGEDGKRATATQVRAAEARDVAATILTTLDEAWTIAERTPQGERTRPLRLGDITLLVPTRTSLGTIEDALDAAGIAYRTEATSLVHAAPEVRALLTTARAVADPSDRLALVTALRSPLFGIDDGELYEHRRAGRTLDLRAPLVDAAERGPVDHALAALRALADELPRRSPSELLGMIAERRRSFEIAAENGPRARDAWRRIRYVIEQARAWTETEHGSLRGYLDWVRAQSDGGAEQAAESVLPETDTDGIRITTIHASKGLDFPMVILAGLGSSGGRRGGVDVRWGEEGFEVSVTAALATRGAAEAVEREKVMADAERMRLLYVAATRARDHLVVSLHRPLLGASSHSAPSSAEAIHRAGGAEHGAVPLTPLDGAPRSLPGAVTGRVAPPVPWEDWAERAAIVRRNAQRVWSSSASTLEGSDVVDECSVHLEDRRGGGPDLDAVRRDRPRFVGSDAALARLQDPRIDGPDAGTVVAEEGVDEAPSSLTAHLAPGTPGRGAAIGDAVHAALHLVPLDPGVDVAGAVRAQCERLGIPDLAGHVAALVRSALAHPLLAQARAGRHWKEAYVGAPAPETAPGSAGTVRDGIIDLLYEDSESELVVLDYKTDHVPLDALGTRTTFYAPQLREYARLVEVTTGRPVSRAVLLFLAEDEARARDVDLGVA